MSIYLQGTDFKAREWAKHFPSLPSFFTTIRDSFKMLTRSRSGDVIIYRYQNNPERLLTAVADTTLLFFQLLKCQLLSIRVVWICHNVNQDTLPYHKWLEFLRRSALLRFSDHVLVLDQAFLPFVGRDDAVVISFGRKRDGFISIDNLKKITEFCKSRDLCILIASQDLNKYLSFERIPTLHARLSPLYGNIGFITAGMDEDRRFSPKIEQDILRVNERNIDEKKLSRLVDFIYRENDDISLPYTVYAAATARIPILTDEKNLLSTIIRRERIGMTIQELENGEKLPHEGAFQTFLDNHRWDSLANALKFHGALL